MSPVLIPWTNNAPKITASGGVPGIPRHSVGIKPPPTVALFAVSDAIKPSGSPLPKLSLFLELLFASPYETMLAILPPAPGRIPIKVPMNAPLNASNFLRYIIKKDSFNLKLLGVVFSLKCFPFMLVRSKITGIQKSPIIALTISIPLFKKLIFQVILISPPITATPIIDINKPRQAPINDLMLSPSANVEINVRPKIANQKYSVGPNFREMLAKGGANNARHITPTIPPTNDDIQLIDIAKSPLPLFAIGYPSNVVATADGVPGVLIKIADHEPPKMAPV